MYTEYRGTQGYLGEWEVLYIHLTGPGYHMKSRAQLRVSFVFAAIPRRYVGAHRQFSDTHIYKHVCMYVCMYVCMCVHIYMYVYVHV